MLHAGAFLACDSDTVLRLGQGLKFTFYTTGLMDRNNLLCYSVRSMKNTRKEIRRKEGTAMFIKLTVVRNAAANKIRNYGTGTDHRLFHMYNTSKIAYAAQVAYSDPSVRGAL